MSDLTHLFKVGQPVKYKCIDDYTNKFTGWAKGTVKETYVDHIIVDIPSISDHMWFEDGFNLDMIYPEYNFAN